MKGPSCLYLLIVILTIGCQSKNTKIKADAIYLGGTILNFISGINPIVVIHASGYSSVTIKPLKIKDIKVLETIKEGKSLYKRKS